MEQVVIARRRRTVYLHALNRLQPATTMNRPLEGPDNEERHD